MQAPVTTEVLFIGGRSGVGKTSVAAEVSRLLILRDTAHALIEGDNLDQAHPEPWRHGIDLAEQNLAAMWANYRAAGYSRLLFTNTVSVLQMDPLISALGVPVRAVGVLLTGADATVAERLRRREIGSGLDEALARSAAAAARLAELTPGVVHRVATDERSVADVAAEVLALSGWL